MTPWPMWGAWSRSWKSRSLESAACHHAPMNATTEMVRNVIQGLLDRRQPPATICPSEVARALAPQHWRPLMPQVRAVAVAMAKEGTVDVRQGGRTVDPNGELRGPIRIGRPVPQP